MVELGRVRKRKRKRERKTGEEEHIQGRLIWPAGLLDRSGIFPLHLFGPLLFSLFFLLFAPSSCPLPRAKDHSNSQPSSEPSSFLSS